MTRRIFKDAGNKAHLFLLFGLLIGTFGSTSLTAPSNKLSYGLFVGLALVFFFRVGFHERLRTLLKLEFQPYDAIPLLLLAVWAYGLARGVYFGNNNVLRNFAGMTLYFIYYILLVEKINKFDLLRCVLYAAAVNACYMFGFFIWDKIFSQYFYGHAAFGALDVRDYYSETLMLLAAPIILIFHKLFSFKARTGLADHLKHRPGLVVLLCLYVFAFLQISFSKATVVFYMACLFVFMAYFCRNVLGFIWHRQVTSLLTITLAVCLSLYPVMMTLNAYIPETVRDKIETYVPESARRFIPETSVRAHQVLIQGEAQVVRKQQAAALKQDLSILGKGLGALLSTGYKRDAEGYGFEANYWNLLHKFGVFSLFIYFVYFFIAYKILVGLMRFKSRYFSLASGAIFVGLIMGFGNPVLMSPVMVCLQCIALYWLRNDNQRRPVKTEQLT
jgi:hypothetical protein